MKTSPWAATPARNKQDYLEKRERLLASAAALFVEKGFRDASLADVAERLNISKPALYHYISSKEDLLFEIAKRALDDISAALEQAAASGGTGRDKLRAFIPDYVKVIVSTFGRCAVRTDRRALTAARQQELRDIVHTQDAALRKILREGARDGSLENLDEKLAAAMIFGAVSWVPRWHRESGRLTRTLLTNSFIEILERGFAARP
jgi:AcrR family transcriptional regulator